MNDVNINLHIYSRELPEKVKGISTKDGNTVTVVTNEAETEDAQTLAFLHECLHIWHGDHDRGALYGLEKERHEELIRLLKIAEKGGKA